MKRTRTFSKITMGAGIVLIATLSACKQNPNQNNPENLETVEVTHKLETIAVPENPEPFVVLDYSTLENLDALGLKPAGIPKLALPHFLQEYKDDQSITDVGSIAEANLERINELQPQVIFSGGRLEEQYSELKRIAPTIQPANDGSKPFETLETNLDFIGTVFDKKEETDQLFADLMTKADKVKKQAAQHDLTAMIIMHNKGKFSAYGKGSRFGIIHDFIGIKEAVEGLSTHRHGNVASSEYILEANPDVLFVIDRNTAIASGEPLDRSFVENALVKQTNAFKNGKIIYLDSQAWYLAGGGIISLDIMLEEIAKAFEQ